MVFLTYMTSGWPEPGDKCVQWWIWWWAPVCTSELWVRQGMSVCVYNLYPFIVWRVSYSYFRVKSHSNSQVREPFVLIQHVRSLCMQTVRRYICWILVQVLYMTLYNNLNILLDCYFRTKRHLKSGEPFVLSRIGHTRNLCRRTMKKYICWSYIICVCTNCSSIYWFE